MAPRKSPAKPARKPAAKVIPPAPTGAAAAIVAAIIDGGPLTWLTGSEPAAPMPPPVVAEAAPAALAAVDPEAADPNNWTVEDGPRGRIVTLSRGEGPTMTFEEVLPNGASPAQVDAAKARILSRHKG